jgi:hypothetical protein
MMDSVANGVRGVFPGDHVTKCKVQPTNLVFMWINEQPKSLRDAPIAATHGIVATHSSSRDGGGDRGDRWSKSANRKNRDNDDDDEDEYNTIGDDGAATTTTATTAAARASHGRRSVRDEEDDDEYVELCTATNPSTTTPTATTTVAEKKDAKADKAALKAAILAEMAGLESAIVTQEKTAAQGSAQANSNPFQVGAQQEGRWPGRPQSSSGVGGGGSTAERRTATPSDDSARIKSLGAELKRSSVVDDASLEGWNRQHSAARAVVRDHRVTASEVAAASAASSEESRSVLPDDTGYVGVEESFTDDECDDVSCGSDGDGAAAGAGAADGSVARGSSADVASADAPAGAVVSGGDGDDDDSDDEEDDGDVDDDDDDADGGARSASVSSNDAREIAKAVAEETFSDDGAEDDADGAEAEDDDDDGDSDNSIDVVQLYTERTQSSRPRARSDSWRLRDLASPPPLRRHFWPTADGELEDIQAAGSADGATAQSPTALSSAGVWVRRSSTRKSITKRPASLQAAAEAQQENTAKNLLESLLDEVDQEEQAPPPPKFAPKDRRSSEPVSKPQQHQQTKKKTTSLSDTSDSSSLSSAQGSINEVCSTHSLLVQSFLH